MPESKEKEIYLFTAICSNNEEPANVKLNTKTPDGEICTRCGGTPNGSTGKVCHPVLTPNF